MDKLVSLRDKIGENLIHFGKIYESIVVIDNDLAKSTTTNKFNEKFPERFFELGISEQSGMSIAHGLSSEGNIPFYVNFSIFSTGTAWTQLRQICYSNANVKIIGTHPGIDNGPDGATHHANEDFALTRSLPNLDILVPRNENELQQAIEYAIQKKGPVYIRVARGQVVSEDIEYYPIDWSMPEMITNNHSELAIIFEGTSSKVAFETSELLNEHDFEHRLINIRRIKPFSEEKIIECIKGSKLIVTIENHSIIGGIGTVISEILFSNNEMKKLIKIGIEDTFTESGNSEDLKKKYGLNPTVIVEKIIEQYQTINSLNGKQF